LVVMIVTLFTLIVSACVATAPFASCTRTVKLDVPNDGVPDISPVEVFNELVPIV